MSKYTLNVLFGQRICSYEGEYAPEALAVMDEFGQEENPDYLRDEHEKHRKSGDFTALRVIQISVPFDAVESALNTPPKVDGVVNA